MRADHTLTRSQEGVLHGALVSPDPARFTVGEAIELTGPDGWRPVHGPVDRASALGYVEENWADITALS